MEEFASAIAIISVFKPVLVNFIKSWWTYKIKDLEKRKSTNILIALFLSTILSFSLNYLGSYNLNIIQILTVGTSVSFGVGQLAHRGANLISSMNGKKS